MEFALGWLPLRGLNLVRLAGFEPALEFQADFKSAASTDFAPSA